MKTKINHLAVILLLALMPWRAADAATFLNGVPANKTVTSKSNATLGYAFRVGADAVRVLQLGFWDQGANGLAESHQIGIWNTSGGLLASTTVNAGTGDTLSGNFRFASLLDSLVLNANTVYIIAAKFYNVDSSDAFFMGSATLASGVTWDSSRDRYSAESDSFLYPDSSDGSSAYIGPNFQFEVIPAVVPEPDTPYLLITGAGLIFFLRRLGKRDAESDHLAQSARKKI